MKILSIQNQKMQKMQNLQNSNNRPISFGDLKSVVAGETFRDGGHYIAVVLKATGKDLEDLRDVLAKFPHPQKNDVFHISAKRWIGNEETGYRYKTFLNGHEFSWSDNVYEMLTHPERQNDLAVIKKKVDALLAKLFGNEKFEVPKKKSAERREMLEILAPEGQLQATELAPNKKAVSDIAGLLAPIIEEGETYGCY